ncbi:MAG: acyl carrier protein [Clostridia bacterium]|nr:acyl carrier protein [Clostridia bacterium]MBQ1895508.1 acyl carrier protein [Clostridia bacterium]MBQ2092779.1 acyl carrier protein [Clostridia bacterium]MBQ3897473.1 acyl carrier protein [Clostridia bacterium]
MVFEKIRAMIAEQLEIDEDTITMDSALIEDLGADSLDVVDLVMSIEDEFEIEVPDEAIENMRTIGDAVRFIEANK